MSFFLKIIFLAFLLIFPANAEIIKDIKIVGNQRISTATILLFSKINKDSEITEKDLNNIIKNLYSTDFFKDVKVTFYDQVLKISVNENPIVQTVVFKGIKKKSIIEVLEDNLQLKEKNPFI